MKGLAHVTNLMMVYRWQETVYLNDPVASGDFKEVVRPLYAKILEYEAKLLAHQKKSSPLRWAKDVFSLDSWSEELDCIRDLDAKCKKVTDVIADARAKAWQDEERIWQETLLQQPRIAREKENIRKLYSNYEAHKNLNPNRIHGTCEWFLNHTSFLVWRESQSSSLLWLSADPGCGKSVLSKYLVDRQGEVLTVNLEQPVICYFFFKETDADRRIASKAICALLHQLLMQQRELYRYLEDDFEIKGDDFLLDTSTLWARFLKAATNSASHEVICVLDALDECEARSRENLIYNVVKLFKSIDSGNHGKSIIKFIITSRPEINIERDFRPLTRFARVRLRGEDESDHIQREIDIVIEHRVRKLGFRIGLSTADQQALQDNLSKTTHRTYLWLYLTFDEIEQKLTFDKKDIATISGAIPESVEEAYTAILNRSPDRDKARKLLHIVLAASYPLTLDEVNMAMNIRESDKYYKDIRKRLSDDCEAIVKNTCGLFLECREQQGVPDSSDCQGVPNRGAKYLLFDVTTTFST